MRKVVVFNNVSLDGYFVDQNGDMSWAHANSHDPEFQAFIQENAKGADGMFLFGRITYQMLAGYWSTPFAIESNPVVAGAMNNTPKIVFSRTLEEASWSNTTLLKGDLTTEVAKLKAESDRDMVIFGSGNLVAQLAQADLIDEYQIVVNPIVLGAGRSMFDGVEQRISLKLTKSRTFSNGNVFLNYEPAE